jgi:hypothetical protein
MVQAKKATKAKDLPAKKVDAKKAEKVKGGVRRTGPGTQTEDDVYVGRSVIRR